MQIVVACVARIPTSIEEVLLDRFMQASDLVTDPTTRAKGFESQALKKSELMESYIERGLDAIKEIPERPIPYPEMSAKLQDFLIAAAGLSKKSTQHLDGSTIERMLSSILQVSKLSDESVKNDLFYRYLLTSGDALGGTMRNIIGDLGQTRLIEALSKEFQNATITFETKNSNTAKTAEITWAKQTFLFNRKPKFIDKSIDVIVLKKDGRLEDPSDYLACGELKSGIDPAGADEHWKTAKSALARIRTSFLTSRQSVPKLFFVGAAIESNMATEAIDMLSCGELDFAANLFKDDQLSELLKSLIHLA
jgi:hypothetical protein